MSKWGNKTVIYSGVTELANKQHWLPKYCNKIPEIGRLIIASYFYSTQGYKK